MSDLNISSDSVVAAADAMSFPTMSETNNTGVGGMKQESKIVDFSKINFSLDMNPREDAQYKIEKLAWLARSIFTYGLQEPPLVSQRADGSLHMLRGFLRGTAIRFVRTVGVPAVKGEEKTSPAIPVAPNFMDKLNVLVIKGLTRQQEIDLVMDHGTKTGLTEVGKLTSAKIMLQSGFSRNLIAAKLNMSVSNFNNGLGRVLSMPTCVEAAYVAKGKDEIKVTQANLKPLYDAYTLDQKLPGAKIKQGGDNFAAAWEKIVTEGNTKRPKVMSHADITAVAEVTLNPDVRDILQAIRDNDGPGLASAIIRVELSIKLTTTTNSGFVRIEEGIPTTVGDFDREDNSQY